jgi:deoxyadenosine/deoxycytidine kinase
MMYVTIEGNIGAGKSLLVDAVRARLPSHVVVLSEPVERWQDALRAFYAGANNGLDLQLSILRARDAQLREALQHATTSNIATVAVVERCAESSSEVFVPCLARNGRMTANEYKEYKRVYAERQTAFLGGGRRSALAGVVYVDADPETCFARARERARSAEEGLDLPYLRELHGAYENWLAGLAERGAVPIVRVANDAGRERAAYLEAGAKAVENMLLSVTPCPAKTGTPA